MDDLDMQLYEAAKEFKRRDFVASICNSYVLGHIEGFSETYQKALKIMEKCGKVINAGVKVGSMNQKMGELLRIAEERRMLVSI